MTCFTRNEIYKRKNQRNLMVDEIHALLEDSEMMHHIGQKTYKEFETDVIMPLKTSFNHTGLDEHWTLHGHRLTLIRWYCDKFNEHKND